MTPEEQEKLMDHEYDGIQEFDNNLPGWWTYGFYFCILFAFVYMIIYYVVGWAPVQEGEYKEEMQTAYNQYKLTPSFLNTSGLSYDVDATFELLKDEEAIAAGKSIFTSNKSLCYTCHGPEGQGLVGPNLTDEYWRNGCDVKQIAKNITTGFPIKGMVPFGSGQKLSAKELNQVVAFLYSIRGSNPANPKPIDPTRDIKCQ